MISPAKINWSLRIVGRQPNGLHLIESIFLPIFELCDDIQFELILNAPVVIEATGKFADKIPLDQTNLMAIALKKLGEKLKLKIGGNILINKEIPVAAGLGGGSSNAATILILAEKQLAKQSIKIDAKALAKIAAKVGSDVTFFLNPTPSLVKGTGKLVQPIATPTDDLYALLVTPAFEISAKDAYQIYRDSEAKFTLKTNHNTPINDLGAAVSQKYIALHLIMKQLKQHLPTASFVSGSGPTCVALYETKDKAQSAQESFSQNFHTILTNL
ncbi:MAG: hypothetical protein KAG98_05740 [Lentisphaeria bacterium]|nr:hypothetical protein [Lentisphaeria bacterium]